MSLRLRRGTDAERQAVTFLEGELVYTTDTKKVFVGDGSTLGGVAIDSALGSIGTLTDVDISGVAIGQVLQWNGASFVPGNADKESVYGNDSTILVDTISSAINLDGTVKGNIVPDANIAYDLGSSSNRFRDLYLSGTSIDLGGTTISIAGGKVNFGAPVQAEFELNQNMDIKNYYITSTDATPNISIRPGANADFHVATVAGTKKFEVDLDTNTYGTPSGEKSVLQLPVFETADYTAHSADESLGQIVFDDPSKTLKVYNGTSWVTVQGSGSGTGIIEGQTYEININGDVIQDDSTILVDTTNGEFKGNLVASNRDVVVSSGADGDASTVTAGIVYAGDLQAETISAVNLEALITQGPTRAASTLTIGTITADTITGNFTGTLVSDDSTVLLDGINGQSAIKNNVVTDAILQQAGQTIRLVSTSGNVQIGGADIDGTHIDTTLVIDREGTSEAAMLSQNYHSGASRATDFGAVKYRGTVASPTAIQSGDKLLEITARGYDGSTVKSAGDIGITATSDASGTVISSKIILQVGNTAGTGGTSFEGNSDGVWKANGFVGGIQTISGPGAIDVVNLTTEITTTGADAFTLADGTSGQIKIIVLATDGGDATITPTTFANGTTITMDDQHESVMLQYGANGWVVIASQNAVIA
jgi:hypothetical protein